MNKIRRKELERALEALSAAMEIIERVMDDEREAFDNLPEPIQTSERGEQMEEYIGTLEEIGDALSDAYDSIEEIVGG